MKGAKRSNAHHTSTGTKSATLPSPFLSVTSNGKIEAGKPITVVVNQKHQKPFTITVSGATTTLIECLTMLDNIKLDVERLAKEIYKNSDKKLPKQYFDSVEFSDSLFNVKTNVRELLCDSIYLKEK